MSSIPLIKTAVALGAILPGLTLLATPAMAATASPRPVGEAISVTASPEPAGAAVIAIALRGAPPPEGDIAPAAVSADSMPFTAAVDPAKCILLSDKGNTVSITVPV
ncbi:hypothetical protein [Actinacidiphila sp. bgisy144]|uniref:hypothetical protein n=1 Tax=Actinacidiphila sp. bgisy144 TaxID=3413791 RepID=UPI003EB6FC24